MNAAQDDIIMSLKPSEQGEDNGLIILNNNELKKEDPNQ